MVRYHTSAAKQEAAPQWGLSSVSDVPTEAWIDDLDFPCIPEGHLESQSRGVTDATHSPAELNPFWEALESLSVQGQIELISEPRAAAWGSLSFPGSLLSSVLCVTLAWTSVSLIGSALPRLGWETPQAHGCFLFGCFEEGQGHRGKWNSVSGWRRRC